MSSYIKENSVFIIVFHSGQRLQFKVVLQSIHQLHAFNDSVNNLNIIAKHGAFPLLIWFGQITSRADSKSNPNKITYIKIKSWRDQIKSSQVIQSWFKSNRDLICPSLTRTATTPWVKSHATGFLSQLHEILIHFQNGFATYTPENFR